MLIQILPHGKDGAREVAVTDETGELAKFTAPTLKDAHKMIKAGRKDGWDSLKAKPAKGA